MDWNSDIKIYPTDRLFAATVVRLMPSAVRPNHLTIFRLVLVPFVLTALLSGRFGWGLGLFLVASLTDWFDGALARTRREVTRWGVIYDPVVDKILIGTTLLVIVTEYMNATLGIVLLGVEAAIVFQGWYYVRRGGIQPASRWGKAKMVAEVVGISLLLLALLADINLLVGVSHGTIALAIVFAVISVLTRIK